MAIGKDIFALETIIGYKFADIKQLETAVTHSSYSNEKRSQGLIYPSNERLEFLGDAVLEIVISEYLFDNHKQHAEGNLTKMRQYLVCEKTLSQIALNIGVGEYLNLGRGEENTDCRNRRKVLADALEALIGAVYVDCGADKSIYVPIVLRLFGDELQNAVPSRLGDFKTRLQELVEKDGSAILLYEVIEETGPEHDKTFTVVAKVNSNIVGRGTSKSKKDAEMQAAAAALALFGVSL